MTARRRLIVACSLLLVVATIAVSGYRIIGGPSVSLLDAIYTTVVTLSGVEVYEEILHSSHNSTLPRSPTVLPVPPSSQAVPKKPRPPPSKTPAPLTTSTGAPVPPKLELHK